MGRCVLVEPQSVLDVDWLICGRRRRRRGFLAAVGNRDFARRNRLAKREPLNQKSKKRNKRNKNEELTLSQDSSCPSWQGEGDE